MRVPIGEELEGKRGSRGEAAGRRPQADHCIFFAFSKASSMVPTM
jgi:hypothetical protein